MGQMLALIGGLCWLGAFIVAILMAVKMFKANQIWQGIVSILCVLFAAVYGFMKKDELGLGSLPLICTVLLLAAIVLRVIGTVMMVQSGAAG